MSYLTPTMLKAAEAGKLLGVSARTMYALAAAGKVAHHRIGVGDGAVRFDPADIEAYKLSCRSPATTPAAGEVDAEPEAPEELPPAFVAYFSLDRPKVPWEPQQELTRHQRRKQAAEQERCRQEDRRALVAFHTNKRRAAALQRTPPWSDLESMRTIYAQAQRLTLETGIPHHVDHEIPLQGELVSGLHVPNNLQILTGSENSRKRNTFEVEA